MKLYKLLTLALTVLTVVAFASVTTFAQEEGQDAAMLCAAAATNMSLIPIAVASLVIPSAVIAVRRRRRPKK
jgi:hypothetical protein